MVGVPKRDQDHARIVRGAVPFGQHSHKPDDVMPLSAVAPSGAPIADVTHAYAGLARPAPRALGCVRCPATAALVDPATGRAYCAAHWIEGVVQRQMD